MSYYIYTRDKLRDFIAKTNRDNLINNSLPIVANVSYLVNSTKFLAPALFSKICGEYSLTISRTLFINSIFGNVLYLFTCKHMRNTEIQYALGYSAFGSMIFNFGSILFWSLSKVYLPQNDYLLALYGFVSSISMLAVAKSYLDLIEASV